MLQIKIVTPGCKDPSSLHFSKTTKVSLLTFNEEDLTAKMLYINPAHAGSYYIISPYVHSESSVELRELGNSTLCRHPLGASVFSWGSEMAFLMMGEMSGGGDDVSREPPRGLATEFFRTCRKVRVKNPVVLELCAESGLPGSLTPP